MADTKLSINTPAGETDTTSLENVLKALPKHKQLMLHWSDGDNKVIANFGGGHVASGEDVSTAVAAAYEKHLADAKIGRQLETKNASFIGTALRRPLAGETIPKGAIAGHSHRR